jgi:Ca2+ transporting ATPase
LLIFLFFGPLMFSDSYNLWSGYNKDGDSTPQTRHFTFLFALFMYMNLFNELNSRKLGEKEVNIFSNIHHNLLYIVIVIGEFAVVYVMTHYNHLVFSSATIPTY